jgi:hypothetical protein
MRLNARLEASGLSSNWQSRSDLTEAVRAMILDGHLVDVGDLVLHDAGMDVRSPIRGLTWAAAALRTRLPDGRSRSVRRHSRSRWRISSAPWHRAHGRGGEGGCIKEGSISAAR